MRSVNRWETKGVRQLPLCILFGNYVMILLFFELEYPQTGSAFVTGSEVDAAIMLAVK